MLFIQKKKYSWGFISVIVLFFVVVIFTLGYSRQIKVQITTYKPCESSIFQDKNIYMVESTQSWPPVKRSSNLSYSFPPGADFDLHAYTLDGKKHIGVNYKTHQYEWQIPSPCSSNDAPSEEWISVPRTTAVYTVIDVREVKSWAKKYGFQLDTPLTFTWQLIFYDENGNRNEGRKHLIALDPSISTRLEIHDDNGDGVPDGY